LFKLFIEPGDMSQLLLQIKVSPPQQLSRFFIVFKKWEDCESCRDRDRDRDDGVDLSELEMFEK
jgi:hypothetical protein